MKAKEYVWKILEEDNEAKEKEMMDIVFKAVKHVKHCDKKLYENIEMELYVLCYGYHLTDEICKEWVSHMENEDGTKGEHWNIDETNSVARQYKIDLDKCTHYEWYATLNMMYSDYYGSVSNDVNSYVRLAQAFLNDDDAKPHKLFNYYMHIVK